MSVPAANRAPSDAATGATGFRRRLPARGVWLLFLAFLSLFTFIYTYLGTVLILEANTSRTGNPQESFIEAAYQSRAARESAAVEGAPVSARLTRVFPQVTDGSIEPLWPWLASAFASASPDALFENGKWLNLFLSCAVLLAMGVAAAKAFSFTGAAALLLMGGFGIVLERSAYFTPDALYCLLVLLTWLCALSLIRQNHLWLYGVFGGLLALTYLTKTPIWPTVLAFALTSAVRTAAESFRRPGADGSEGGATWSAGNQLVGFAMLATAFLLVAGPRLSYAAAEYGDPLHSYDRYFVWLDSPQEASRFRAAFPSGEELASLTRETRPGLGRYLRENGFRSLAERSWSGALAELQASALGRNGWILFYALFVFVAIASIHRWTMWKQDLEIWRVRGTSARWMLTFSFLASGITLFHVGVGHAVIKGNPLTTALFLPGVMTFIWIAERYRRQLQRSRSARVVNATYRVLMALPILYVSLRTVEALRNVAAAPLPGGPVAGA